MTSRRKPLPYHASEAIDQALMELSDARRAVMALLAERPLSQEERYRLLGVVMHNLHEADAWLKTVKKAGKNGS